jgi:hypothetical protein
MATTFLEDDYTGRIGPDGEPERYSTMLGGDPRLAQQRELASRAQRLAEPIIIDNWLKSITKDARGTEAASQVTLTPGVEYRIRDFTGRNDGQIIASGSTPEELLRLQDAAQALARQGTRADYRLEQVGGPAVGGFQTYTDPDTGKTVQVIGGDLYNKPIASTIAEIGIPIALAVAGGAFLGPALAGAAAGKTATGLALAAGSGIGSTAGNLLVGKPLDQALISGLTTAATAGGGSLLGPYVPFVGGTPVGTGIGAATGNFAANIATGKSLEDSLKMAGISGATAGTLDALFPNGLFNNNSDIPNTKVVNGKIVDIFSGEPLSAAEIASARAVISGGGGSTATGGGGGATAGGGSPEITVTGGIGSGLTAAQIAAAAAAANSSAQARQDAEAKARQDAEAKARQDRIDAMGNDSEAKINARNAGLPEGYELIVTGARPGATVVGNVGGDTFGVRGDVFDRAGNVVARNWFNLNDAQKADVIAKANAELLVTGTATGNNALTNALNTGAVNVATTVGGGGNDILVTGKKDDNAAATTAATTVGGGGNDILVTGKKDDNAAATTAATTVGGGGNDILVTGKKDDNAAATTAATTVGGGGNDILVTGKKDDTIVGGGGNDILVTGKKDDTIVGGGGNDTTVGGGGNDTTVGGGGNDLIVVKSNKYPFTLGSLSGLISEPLFPPNGTQTDPPKTTKQKVLATLKTIAGLTPLIGVLADAVGGGGGGGTLDAGPGLPVGGIGGGRGRIPATFDPFTYGQREGEFEFFRNLPATTGTVTGIGGTGTTTGATGTGTTTGGTRTTGTTTTGTPGTSTTATAAEVQAAFPGYTNIRQDARGRWFGEPIPGYNASGPTPTGLRVTAAGTFNPTVEDYRFFNPNFESIERDAAGQFIGTRFEDVPGTPTTTTVPRTYTEAEIRNLFPNYTSYTQSPTGQWTGSRTTSTPRTYTEAEIRTQFPGYESYGQEADGQWYGVKSESAPAPNTQTGGPALAEGGEVDDDMVRHLIEYRKGGGHMGPGQVKGIGSGQEDKIPAWLSDGEYVWSAQDVADLGDGSTDEGVRRLDRMRKMVRQRAGRKDVKKIAKPQRGIEDMLKAVGGAV